MPFEFLDHVADAGLRVTGRTKGELFEDAALGMFRIISEEAPAGWPESRSVELSAQDDESLLVDWLTELLYLFDVKRFRPVSVRVEFTGTASLKAHMDGIRMEGTITGTEIKAVTWHMLNISETTAGFETDIYFDL